MIYKYDIYIIKMILNEITNEITNEKINGATRINITKTDLEGGNDITLTGNRLDIDTVFVRNDSNSNKQGNLIMNALDSISDTKLHIFSDNKSELVLGVDNNNKWEMNNDNNIFNGGLIIKNYNNELQSKSQKHLYQKHLALIQILSKKHPDL